MFVQKVHANSLNDVKQSLHQSQQETSKIESNLEDVKSEKQKLLKETQLKEEKILQLEKENSELKG